MSGKAEKAFVFGRQPTAACTATAGDSIAVLDRNGQPEVLTSKGSHKVISIPSCRPGSGNLFQLRCLLTVQFSSA